MEYKIRRGLFYDPVEDTEEYKIAVVEIQEELDKRMKDFPQGMGSCHKYWQLKKELLKKVGIDWKTPQECNPRVVFD